MTSNPLLLTKNDKLVLLLAASILRKILTSFKGERIGYRRLRWVVCSRTSLTKREANQILLLLKKEGLIATTKPQANSEQLAWLTPQGLAYLNESVFGAG
jgi:hypothetical protein